jgi:iron complex outermembrane receptor protein
VEPRKRDGKDMKKTRQIGSSRQNTQPIFKPKHIASLLLFTSVSLVAWAEDKPQTFDIPALPLDSALTELADKANLRLLYQADLVAKLRSQPVSGQYSPEQALKILLGQSGLGFRKTADNAFTVEAVPPAPHINQADPTTLPKVSVVGNAVYDAKDPYNEDYVLPNATSGTKTDTPIMETPLNVQVISKQVLKDQQVIRLEDALKNVSGVTFGSFQYGSGNAAGPAGGLNGFNSGSQFTLRGFADSTFFRDGFRLQQGAASREMANIESIEVLKGSAAILYGLVEPGGMVNVITKQPLATPYYSVNQQFGSYNLYRTTVDATGPLTSDKSLLYRMNLSYENSGSFRDLVFNDNVFFAPVLKWNISDRTQATVELEYQHKNFVGDTGFIPFQYQAPTGQGIPANVPFSNNYGQYTPGQADTLFTSLNWSHQFNDDWTIKHRVSANRSKTFQPYSFYQVIGILDQNTLNSLLPYGLTPPSNLIGRTYGQTGYNNLTYYNTYATNLDLIGHFDTGWLKHTLLLGGDYYRVDSIASGENNRNSVQNYINYGSGAETSYVNLNNPQQGINWPGVPDPGSYSRAWNKTHQFGLYLQDQIKLPYEFFLTGGLRYQYINQGGNSSYMSDPSTLVTTPNQPITQDAITPRFGLLWHPLKWLSSYINYTESFGANTSGFTWPNNQVVPPTSAQQYEGGLKFEFFDGRLRATTAYYDLTKTNMASGDPNFNHICNGQIGSCYVAIGAVNSHGPEIDVQGELLKGWNMIATYAYTDINITKTDSQNSPFLGVYPIGTRFWGVPHNKASLFSTYEFQVDELKGLKFGGGVNIQDSSLACCSSPLQNVPGFTTLDLLSAYSLDIGKTKVSAQLNVKNLLDHRYYMGMAIENGTTGGAFANFGTPRTIMGSINVQY